MRLETLNLAYSPNRRRFKRLELLQLPRSAQERCRTAGKSHCRALFPECTNMWCQRFTAPFTPVSQHFIWVYFLALASPDPDLRRPLWQIPNV